MDCSALLLRIALVLFLVSVIPLALSWSGFQNEQTCGTQAAYCCWVLNGDTNCTPLTTPGISCPNNFQMYCGTNLTPPIMLSPSWKFPLGVASAVVMGVSGAVLLVLGGMLCFATFLTGLATAGRRC